MYYCLFITSFFKPRNTSALYYPWLRLIAVAFGVFLSGCTVGEGDGWVQGSMWIKNCKEGNPLDEQNTFALGASFFVGELLPDSNPDPSQQRNRLIVRIQDTSNNIEFANGLTFEFSDLAAAARSCAEGHLLPITNQGVFTADDTSNVQKFDLLRSRLYLFASCPDARQPMVGSNIALTPKTIASIPGDQCLQPTAPETLVCPTLSPSDRQELDTVCNQINSPASKDIINRILGSSACLYLCQLGTIQKGQTGQTYEGFSLDYGDQIVALFSMNIVDARSVTFLMTVVDDNPISTAYCAQAQGRLSGAFRFEIRRGRAAQSFP